MKQRPRSVPDPHTPRFREEAHRRAQLLRDAPEEQEATNFIEAILDIDDQTG